MQKLYGLLFFALILSLAAPDLGAQIPATRLNSGEVHSVPYRIRKKEWTEIIPERSLHSASFRKDDGTWVSYSSKELVNYPDESGKLVPVNTELLPHDGGWKVAAQPYSFFLSIEGAVEIQVSKSESIRISDRVRFNSVPLQAGAANIHGDTAMFYNQLPGMYKFLHFRSNAVKYSYVFQNASGLPAGDLLIEEEVILPEDFVFVRDDAMSEIRNDKIAGHLLVRNAKGEEMMRMASAFCYDAAGNWVLAEYRFTREGNRVKLETHVPAAWLHDADRVFPLVIDPLVTGPTSTYPNAFMPSCFFPNYNVDSILINVPAAITVNNLSVTGSYYADPFTSTTMADGRMYFSTTCNSSTVFTIAPPGGTTPGTAYLEDFNLKSPLTCCFPQTCNAYTFYLRMHISRTVNGTGCNTTYLYYNPSTMWPFSAYIEGNTVESYTSNVYLNPSTLCANECQTVATVYARYGVPPFTFSHPWSATSVTAGQPVGCSPVNEIETLQLINPNCPDYCDPATSIAVPAPQVVDACGNTISGWPALSLTLKPIAQVTAFPDSLVICSGEDAQINLNACLPGATIHWSGNGQSGNGSINDSTLVNNSPNLLQLYYSSFVSMNGCTSDTILIPVVVESHPQSGFSNQPDPVFITQPVVFSDQSQSSSSVVSESWSFGEGTLSNLSSPQHTYTVPGEYLVCHSVTTENFCSDTLCRTIQVLPLTIIPPNVISPNNDGKNDALIFPYLEFYESNTLLIMNRWGNLIYEKQNYANDWKAEGYPDGVYYFILKAGEQDYSGFFHILR